MKKVSIVVALSFLCAAGACKTRNDLRKEQEIERMQAEISSTRGQKADFEVLQEELKTEMARLSNVVEEVAQQHRHDADELKKDLNTLSTRIQALEQRAVADELNQKQAQAAVPVAAEKPSTPTTYGAAKKLYDEGKYEEAEDVLKTVIKNQPKSEDAKKSQFLLAETHFATKDYASAALEYENFRKNYPKDGLAPNAVYRQAHAFKGMGKTKEARLFFQDLIERYPKSPFAAKAKLEMKKLK
jgi:tol-pal system protein YbgF